MTDDTDNTSGAPTVTEYIPDAEVPLTRDDDTEDLARVLQATGDGGLERVTTESYADGVVTHVFVCDTCGESFPTEEGAGHHLQYSH